MRTELWNYLCVLIAHGIFSLTWKSSLFFFDIIILLFKIAWIKSVSWVYSCVWWKVFSSIWYRKKFRMLLFLPAELPRTDLIPLCFLCYCRLSSNFNKYGSQNICNCSKIDKENVYYFFDFEKIKIYEINEA